MNEGNKAEVFFTENGKEYKWWVSTLWESVKDLQDEEVAVESLLHELKFDRWFQIYVPPTVENVLQHFTRIQNADFMYPVILSPSGRVLDGVHRLCKAVITEQKTIRAVRLLKLPPSDY